MKTIAACGVRNFGWSLWLGIWTLAGAVIAAGCTGSTPMPDVVTPMDTGGTDVVTEMDTGSPEDVVMDVGCGDTQSSVANCGSCGNVCPNGPQDSTAVCTEGVCGFECNPGFYLMGTTVCAAIQAPRPIAPMSTSTVTSRRPTLRWSLPAGIESAQVEICRDRACEMLVTMFAVNASSGRPAMDLPASTVLFWRLRGQVGDRTGTTVSPTWEFRVGARSATVDSSYGTFVDVNGDGLADVLVGAPLDNSGGGANQARAFVFHGEPNGVSGRPSVTLTGPGDSSRFGQIVASAGDINGDGYGDVVVGAERVYLYFGGPNGLRTTPSITVTGPGGELSFGAGLAGVGDINGDGYGDLVVGVQSLNRAYVYLGNVDLPETATTVTVPATTPLGTALGPAPTDRFGSSVAGAGDVNGDGFADVLIAATGVSSSRGAVYVFNGSATGLAQTPSVTLGSAASAGDIFGRSIAGAGDINGDGYSDVIVGASNALNNQGLLYYFLGAAPGLNASPGSITGPMEGARFGYAVASAGDVDADGFSDVIVGAPFFEQDGVPNTGRVQLHKGSATGLVVTAAQTLISEAPSDSTFFGGAVGGGGDLNGDGYTDVVVGAHHADQMDGRAYAYLWNPTGSGLLQIGGILFGDPATSPELFGITVASLGVKARPVSLTGRALLAGLVLFPTRW